MGFEARNVTSMVQRALFRHAESVSPGTHPPTSAKGAWFTSVTVPLGPSEYAVAWGHRVGVHRTILPARVRQQARG